MAAPKEGFQLATGDDELVLRFEGLGADCEPGFVHRSVGAEPLGVLRFSRAPIDRMIVGLDEAFSGITEGLEAYDGEPPGVEWSMHAPRYGMHWHTFTSPTAASQVEMVESQAKSVRFLARKFMEDVAPGEKIFVVKCNTPGKRETCWLYFSPCVAPARPDCFGCRSRRNAREKLILRNPDCSEDMSADLWTL
jgi:hypothetical protein